MRRVYKYGTGHDVPEGAQYLCTKVEMERVVEQLTPNRQVQTTHNILVWHYFLVEVPE